MSEIIPRHYTMTYDLISCTWINFCRPCLRRLVACLSQRKSAFDDGPYHVSSVVDKMIVDDWAFLRVLGPFVVNIIPPILHKYMFVKCNWIATWWQ